MFMLHQGHLQQVYRRRDFLRVGGGLAVAGQTLSGNVPGSRASATGIPGGGRSGTAKSCILVYLLGGPPHQEMFDLKPEAPAEVRGPFHPIAASVPGMEVCEHLPRLAGMAERYALVRSVSPNDNHTPMIYYTLTGRSTARPEQDNDLRPPQPDDFPHMGAVLAQFKGGAGALPGYVAVPEVATRSSLSGQYKRARTPLRGGGAGFLGPRFDPLPVNGEPGTSDAVERM